MIKPRHKIIERLLVPIFWLYAKISCNYKVEKFVVPKGPLLILSNHTCTMDPAFVAYAFKKPVYFVGMEDLLSKKFTGSLLKWAFNMIPKSKAQSDPRSVKMIIKTIKEGGRVVLFPSGNRTYDGDNCHIDPSIAKLCKVLNVPVVLVNLVGGYGTDPRWGVGTRRGKLTLVKRDIISKEELSSSSLDDIYNRIVTNLNVVEENGVKFKSRRRAEYLERLLFVCPDCNKLNTMTSNKTKFKCSSCGYEVEYQADLTFKLLNGNKYLRDVKEWFKYEKKFVSELDFTESKLIFEEENVSLYKVYPSSKKEEFFKNAVFKCFSDKLEINSKDSTFTIPFDSASGVCAVGKHKANFTYGDQIYQIHGDKRCNAFKYVMMFYHYQNTKDNTVSPDEYLGI